MIALAAPKHAHFGLKERFERRPTYGAKTTNTLFKKNGKSVRKMSDFRGGYCYGGWGSFPVADVEDAQ
ncbi:MAG: hypothetical protein HYW56_00510 [Candidatus Harrisonbacteria bacterium]|nr:hypothetical protein [Candidatus Harrisonbacteria bacterium]